MPTSNQGQTHKLNNIEKCDPNQAGTEITLESAEIHTSTSEKDTNLTPIHPHNAYTPGNQVVENQVEYSENTPSAEQILSTKILVPNESVGAIIGRGGMHIRDMIEQTQCRISVWDADASPVPGNRIVHMTGSIKSIQQVEERILKKIKGVLEDSSEIKKEEPVKEVQEPSECTIEKKEKKQSLEWMIPSDVVGALIGKGGSGISKIVEKSGARIRVAQAEDMPLGSSERLICIEGTEECTKLARDLILEAVGGRNVDNFIRGYGTTILVPSRSVGYIIGGNGATIREISEKSGARLKMESSEDVSFGSTSRSLRINGTEEEVEKAKSMVCDKIRQHETMLLNSNQILEEEITIRMLVSVEYISALIGKGGSSIKHISEKSNTRIRVITQGEWTEGTNDRVVVIVGPLQYVLTAQELVLNRLEGLRGEINASPCSAPSSYSRNRSYSCDDDERYSQRSRNDSSPIREYDRRGYSTSSNNDSYNTHGSRSHKSYAREYKSAPSEIITRRLMVPSPVVGGLIGKGGSIIRGIRKSSQATVICHPPEGDSDEQAIVVSGYVDNVECAMGMIDDALASSRHAELTGLAPPEVPHQSPPSRRSSRYDRSLSPDYRRKQSKSRRSPSRSRSPVGNRSSYGKAPSSRHSRRNDRRMQPYRSRSPISRRRNPINRYSHSPMNDQSYPSLYTTRNYSRVGRTFAHENSKNESHYASSNGCSCCSPSMKDFPSCSRGDTTTYIPPPSSYSYGGIESGEEEDVYPDRSKYSPYNGSKLSTTYFETESDYTSSYPTYSVECQESCCSYSNSPIPSTTSSRPHSNHSRSQRHVRTRANDPRRSNHSRR